MPNSPPDRALPKGSRVFSLVHRQTTIEEGNEGEVVEVREGVVVHGVKFENGTYMWLLGEELSVVKPEPKAGAVSGRVLAAVAAATPSKLARSET